MKLTFTAEELSLLDKVLRRIYRISLKYQEDDGGAHARTIASMKTKFTPNAAYVSLTYKQRRMLDTIISYRMASLKQQGDMGEEYFAFKHILEKVSPQAPKEEG